MSVAMGAVLQRHKFSDSNDSMLMMNVSEGNIGLLEDLNKQVFPVKYSNQFYKKILLGETFGRICIYNKYCAGAVLGRFQPLEFTAKYRGNFNTAGEDEMRDFSHRNFDKSNPQELYIMTLGVQSDYRRMGIGKKLCDCLIHDAKVSQRIKQVTLHVQTSNKSALNFYTEYGFEITKKIEKYYRFMENGDAYILTYKL